MTALTAKITALAVAAALALTGGLAIQMAQGNDPGLSASKKSATASASSSASSSTTTTASAPATVTTRTS
jgi:hypothetical protein